MMNYSGTGSSAVAIKEYFPEVEDFCVFQQGTGRLVEGDRKSYMSKCYAVTTNFPDIFHPVLVGGDVKQALSDPEGIVITRSFAIKNRGKENPLGEELILVKSHYNGTETVMLRKKFVIRAVIDDRVPGFFDFEQLTGLPDSEISLDKMSWVNSFYSFVKLNKKMNARELENRLNTDTEYKERYRIREKQGLVPLKEVYFSSGTADDRESLLKTRDKSLLYIAACVALSVLLIACFNYINISMTKSLQRLKNVSQQMVFGATSAGIRMQLILETALQVVIAWGIALLLIWYILPGFNRFMNTDLQFVNLFAGFSWWVTLLLIAIIIVGPSLYIFYRLGGKSLNRALKEGVFQRARLVTGMVVVQFAISVVLLLTVLCIRQQMYYIGHIRPGSDQIFMMFVSLEEDDQAKNIIFRKQLIQIPEVTDYTGSNILSSGSLAAQGKSAMILDADSRFIPFYGIEMAEGEVFDENTADNDVLVNETFVKAWGLENPVGFQLDFNGKHRIIGVVKDFVIDNFSRKIQPLMIQYNNRDWENGWITVLKIIPGTRDQVLQKVKESLKKVFDKEVELTFRSMAEIYTELHSKENRILKIVRIFTWISLLLTGLGLFGLAWYSVEIRLKEIGIRKINGATQNEILWLICRKFMIWIGIALLIGMPVAWLIVRQWRMQFVYKEDLSIRIFGETIAIVFAVGLVTVIWQAWKAARVNPARIIKTE